MKELLTKRFWQDVKKTFHEALESPPPAQNESQVPAADKPDNPSPSADHPSPDTGLTPPDDKE